MSGLSNHEVNGKTQVLIVLVLVIVPCLYSSTQEIYATYSPHDDYYFLMRSLDFKLMGSHLAPIKEYLYSAFLAVSRTTGFSLRTFEVACYGLALYFLYRQVRGLQKSSTVAFLSVFPLSLFVYQHPVFNHTTYDALQLILTPLSIGSALQILSRRGSPCSIVTAGVIAGLQTLTRPEGFLFVAPPLIALLWVGGRSAFGMNKDGKKLLYRTVLLVLFPLLFQQGMSAVNRLAFGFWAPTIIKAKDFQSALSALMSIDPEIGHVDLYAPFPKTSMQLAYKVSPEFSKAKPFFEENINGKGWSGYAPPKYRPEDGSLAGGWFQWALLDASLFVVGSKPDAILSYLKQVSNEINSGFETGILKKRSLLSSALGPNFSVWSPQFWSSLRKIGMRLIGYGPPILPSLPRVLPASHAHVESDFDRLALRRTALLGINGWKLEGWLLNPELGMPSNIWLDQEASAADIRLNLIQRPDVAKAILGETSDPSSCLCGIYLTSPGTSAGKLLVSYEEQTIEIPIDRLKAAKPGEAIVFPGIHVQIDSRSESLSRIQQTHFVIVTWISQQLQELMKFVVLIAICYLLASVVFRHRFIPNGNDRVTLALVACITLSIVLPRWVLLAAIDSTMFPGDTPRYLAVGVFSVWFLAMFVFVCMVCDASHFLRRNLKSHGVAWSYSIKKIRQGH